MRNKKLLAVIALGQLFVYQTGFAHAIIDPVAGAFSNSLVGDLALGFLLWLPLIASTVF